KAQPLTSRVLTPAGWVTMGEITVGSAVVGSDGNTYSVLGVYPQGDKPTYRVTLADGGSCEATDEHLWRIQHSGSWRVVDTLELQSLVHAGEPVHLPGAAAAATTGTLTRSLDTLVGEVCAGRINPVVAGLPVPVRRTILLSALRDLNATSEDDDLWVVA